MVFISSKLYHKKGDLAPLFGAKSSFFIAPFFHSPNVRFYIIYVRQTTCEYFPDTHPT